MGQNLKLKRLESLSTVAQPGPHESEISAHRGVAVRPGESSECEHIRMYKANPTQVGASGRIVPWQSILVADFEHSYIIILHLGRSMFELY